MSSYITVTEIWIAVLFTTVHWWLVFTSKNFTFSTFLCWDII